VETDAVAGKRTLVVILGRTFARWQFAGSLALAFGILPVLAWRLESAWLILPWLLLPVAWRHVLALATGRTPAELIALLGATGRLLAAFALLLAAGLILAR